MHKSDLVAAVADLADLPKEKTNKTNVQKDCDSKLKIDWFRIVSWCVYNFLSIFQGIL